MYRIFGVRVRPAATPYAAVLVTLSKQEHIELVWAANYWKIEHRRAAERALSIFPGTEDSEVLEIEVQAYRRVIRRRRYRPSCGCPGVPRIVTAPPPPRLIERGKYGMSAWASVLLDKFLYGRPSHRLLQDLADHGLNMSAGTLAGGLQALAPLFEPLDQALLGKLRSEAHWHADETRWPVRVGCTLPL